MTVTSSTEPTRCRWNPSRGFEADGVPVHVVGVNYVARHICTNFWADWRPEAIREDLARIAAADLNAVRIPIHWEYFEPSPGRFRPEALQRLNAFVEMAREKGLWVMPWFLVGVATMDYDVSWRDGHSFFTEPMLSHAAHHLRTLVSALKGRPNILCWDICDEPEWYSRHPGADSLPYDMERFHAWMNRMIAAVREADTERAVTLGFGHIATGNYGMDIRRAARALDVMAVTAYSPHRSEDLAHGFRTGWFLGWSVRMNDAAGKGVFTCEAPGWSDIEASEENIAHYHRVSLFSNLANGARGVMPWVWNDFDDAIQRLPPMDKYTIEKRFGICRPDGTLKPAGMELRAFAGFVKEFPPHEWPSTQPEVGVIVPLCNPADLHREFAPLFHHFILLRQAGLRVRYVWPDEIEGYDGKLLFLPDSGGQPLLTAQWMQLQAWVEQGGALVSTSHHASSVFNALFGVEMEGRFAARDDVRFASALAPLEACDGLLLPRGNGRLLVKPVAASVRAADPEGRPLVTCHALGKGAAWLATVAPEGAAAALPPEELGQHRAHELFRGMAAQAGLVCPVTCPDPRVELDIRMRADGRLLIVLINHSRFPVQAAVTRENGRVSTVIDLVGNGVSWIPPGK